MVHIKEIKYRKEGLTVTTTIGRAVDIIIVTSSATIVKKKVFCDKKQPLKLHKV